MKTKTIYQSGITITKPAKLTEAGEEVLDILDELSDPKLVRTVVRARKEYKERKAIPWSKLKEN